MRSKCDRKHFIRSRTTRQCRLTYECLFCVDSELHQQGHSDRKSKPACYIKYLNTCPRENWSQGPKSSNVFNPNVYIYRISYANRKKTILMLNQNDNARVGSAVLNYNIKANSAQNSLWSLDTKITFEIVLVLGI